MPHVSCSRPFDRARAWLPRAARPPVRVVVLSSLLGMAGCATLPPAPEVPVISWEQKLSWMMRLEDQRILRVPNPPPPVVLRAATRTQPAIVAPLPPTDLVRLLEDSQARVRRRAALALGRIGLADAVAPLVRRLTDEEPEVRQMSAFALGLIADASARPDLLTALADADPVVQGRAAEALGAIGDRSDAPAVARMVEAHIKAGALASIDPDDVSGTAPPATEAARLGIFALVRLGAYEPLASVVLDANGVPVSRWWPVAYALQRVADPRALPALTTLAGTPGRFTASFAVRGLEATKAREAVAPVRQFVEQRRAHPAVVIQAVRAVAALGDTGAVPVLSRVVADTSSDPTLRLEAMASLAVLAGGESAALLGELMLDAAPAIRGQAARALARVDPEAFTAVLSGLDPDRDWTVRAAQATALGTLAELRGVARLESMLGDADQRVVPDVMAALAAARAPGAERLLVERLSAGDFAVRASAAQALAELRATGAVPALQKAYEASARDTTYVARASILGALSRLDPAAARPLLEAAASDPEWAIRVRSSELLRQQGVAPDALPSIRPARSSRDEADPEWLAMASPRYSPHAFIETDRGTIEIELAVLDAPLTVSSFVSLARKGFFDGLPLHRVVPDFVVQGGDPRGDGEGGPGFTLRDEINQRPYLRGTVGMALDWRDTGGSQFFITHSPQPHLDGRYTVFGHVVAGLEVLDGIAQWDVIRRVRIWDGVSAQ